MGRCRPSPWKGAGRLLLLSFPPAILLAPLARTGLPPFFMLAAGAAVYFVPVALLLWRFGPLSESDREFVRSIMRKLKK